MMLHSTGLILWQALRIISGFALIIVGLVLSLPGIPGPGILLVILGLGILSRHFQWAHKVNEYLKQKWQDLLNRRKGAVTQQENHHG